MTPVYYNEIDLKAAAWLRELCRCGLIPAGEIDTRSIEDVPPDDLKPFRQCHFFAGIGGWAYALQLAGWPDDLEVWTGSCPCQPYSTAGKGAGFADERHLWPYWHYLIDERRPGRVFGEQVASKAALGWWDLVHADLALSQYACWAADLCAAGVGAPHIRQRLYFVANLHGSGFGAWGEGQPALGHGPTVGSDRSIDRLAHGGQGLEGRDLGAMGHERATLERGGRVGGLGQPDQERRGWGQGVPTWRFDDRTHAGRLQGHNGLVGICETGDVARPTGPLHGLWADADWLFCRDDKWRPVEPSTFPLADGLPARVGRLRGYGNAIVPQVAAEMISAYMDHAGIWEQLG